MREITSLRRGAIAWLAAVLVWGCGAGEPAPGGEAADGAGGVADAAVAGTGGSATTAAAAGRADAGETPDSAAATAEADPVPVHRWTPGGEAGLAAHLPGDTDLDQLDASAVGVEGFAIWRVRGDAGDYLVHQPWLARVDGGDGVGLGDEDVYLYSVLRWLPGRETIVLNRARTVQLLDLSGQVGREFPAHPDSGYRTLDLAVHPTDGRIAVALVHEAGWGEGGYRRPLDLAILDAEGRDAGTVPGFTLPASSDGFLWAPDLHWLPDGRVAFLRTTGDEPATESESGGGRRLALVDPADGRIETTSVATDGIVGVGPDGRVLLIEGRLYDPATGELHEPEIPGMTLIAVGGLSPDGAWLAAVARTDGGEDRIGAFRLADGIWQPLGTGTIIGWAPDGGLYWVEGRARP